MLDAAKWKCVSKSAFRMETKQSWVAVDEIIMLARATAAIYHLTKHCRPFFRGEHQFKLGCGCEKWNCSGCAFWESVVLLVIRALSPNTHCLMWRHGVQRLLLLSTNGDTVVLCNQVKCLSLIRPRLLRIYKSNHSASRIPPICCVFNCKVPSCLPSCLPPAKEELHKAPIRSFQVFIQQKTRYCSSEATSIHTRHGLLLPERVQSRLTNLRRLCHVHSHPRGMFRIRQRQ